MPHRETADGLQPYDEDTIEYLRLLEKKGIIRTAEDALKVLEQEKDSKIADRLRNSSDRPLPLRLILARAQIDLEEENYLREDEIRRAYRDRPVGLIWPLPPHFVDEIFDKSEIVILNPADHHITHHLRHLDLEVKLKRRECREAIFQVDALVFEAYRDDGCWYVEEDVDELLDEKNLPAELALIVHQRHHDKPEDVPLTISAQRRLLGLRRRHP
jgi:hypothetical protein